VHESSLSNQIKYVTLKYCAHQHMMPNDNLNMKGHYLILHDTNER